MRSNMKEQILSLIKNNPKSYAKIIKKDLVLTEWVHHNSLIVSDKLPEMIYSAVYQIDNKCSNGKIKKFDRFSTGFVGCGPANTCACTKKSISDRVKLSKSLFSNETNEEINAKREITMLAKYGTKFNSQRPDKKDCWTKPKISEQSYNRLTNFEWLNDQYNNRSRTLIDIANELGVYYSTVGEYCLKFGFTIRQTSNYSTVEVEVCDFLRSVNVQVVQHDWTILKNKEIDIFLPEYNIGIEINGLYWHSWAPNSGRCEDKLRHINKTTEAKENGVKLLHITDYEWHNKQDIIKSMLLSKLGKNVKIFARKCEIREVITRVERDFLNKTHIQGYSVSSFARGLYYNDELVMLITIGKTRFNRDQKYEIIRVSSAPGLTIVGGLSKLINNVCSTIDLPLITYCDIDKSDGNGYKSAGMTIVKSTGPGYFWTDGNQIISRYKSQKKNLSNWLLSFNPNLSEAENMFAAKFRRYWNCGSILFEIT